MLEYLAMNGLLMSFCIDKVHTTVKNHNLFCPEFQAAIESINNLILVSKRHYPSHVVPILTMSATFQIPEQIAFSRLIKRIPGMVFGAPMDKRTTSIYTKIVGDPIGDLMKDWKSQILEDPTIQSILYSNIITACDGSILQRLENAKKNLPSGLLEDFSIMEK